jgi:hypothetical protein
VELTQRNAVGRSQVLIVSMWQPVASAPFNRKLELAVIDRAGPHSLVFPCKRSAEGWLNAETMRQVEVNPTHWRLWKETSSAMETVPLKSARDR